MFVLKAMRSNCQTYALPQVRNIKKKKQNKGNHDFKKTDFEETPQLVKMLPVE